MGSSRLSVLKELIDSGRILHFKEGYVVYNFRNLYEEGQFHLLIELFNNRFEKSNLQEMTIEVTTDLGRKEYVISNFEVIDRHGQSFTSVKIGLGISEKFVVQDIHVKTFVEDNERIYSEQGKGLALSINPYNNNELFLDNYKRVFEYELFPSVFENGFICTCGTINEDSGICVKCSKDIETILRDEKTLPNENIDDVVKKFIQNKKLKTHNDLLAQGKVLHDQYGISDSDFMQSIERLNASHLITQETSKRNKGRLKFIILIWSVLIFSLLSYFVLIPNLNYVKAEKMLSEKKCESALVIFKKLGDFKSSDRLYRETLSCLASQIRGFASTGVIQEADRLFIVYDKNNINEKKSDDLYNEYRIKYADFLYNNGELDESYYVLSSINTSEAKKSLTDLEAFSVMGSHTTVEMLFDRFGNVSFWRTVTVHVGGAPELTIALDNGQSWLSYLNADFSADLSYKYAKVVGGKLLVRNAENQGWEDIGVITLIDNDSSYIHLDIIDKTFEFAFTPMNN